MSAMDNPFNDLIPRHWPAERALALARLLQMGIEAIWDNYAEDMAEELMRPGLNGMSGRRLLGSGPFVARWDPIHGGIPSQVVQREAGLGWDTGNGAVLHVLPGIGRGIDLGGIGGMGHHAGRRISSGVPVRITSAVLGWISSAVPRRITSFGDHQTEDLFHGRPTARVRRFSQENTNLALRKLEMLNAATNVLDLRAPPGNRLEALKGELDGFHSIRVNDQWRIVFRWEAGNAHEVRLLDYHS